MRPEQFSREIPGLRLVWDATTLDTFMRDPLVYFWQYVEGWRPITKPLPLLWGGLYHVGINRYQLRRLEGWTREDALVDALTRAVAQAWEEELDEIAVGAKDGRKRNVATLIRAIIWYDAHYGEDEQYRPVRLADGSPGIEHPFALPLTDPEGQPLKAPTGEDYILAGSLDGIVEDEDGDLLVREYKHTTTTVSGLYYWQRFDPNVQVWTYDLVSAFVLGAHTPLKGVLVDACQTAIGFSNFERNEIVRTDEQRELWLRTVIRWVRFAEQLAMDGAWCEAMNPATSMWDSALRRIEARSPSSWDNWLRANFKREDVWHPLDQGKEV